MHPRAHEQTICAVERRLGQRLAGNRHHALAALAGALGDQLFDPESERLERGRQKERQFVAARTRRGTDCESERDSRILKGCAKSWFSSREHRSSPVDDAAHVVAHQRGRHEAHVGQRGVTAADV